MRVSKTFQCAKSFQPFVFFIDQSFFIMMKLDFKTMVHIGWTMWSSSMWQWVHMTWSLHTQKKVWHERNTKKRKQGNGLIVYNLRYKIDSFPNVIYAKMDIIWRLYWNLNSLLFSLSFGDSVINDLPCHYATCVTCQKNDLYLNKGCKLFSYHLQITNKCEFTFNNQ
jgi:hypothetical protein